MELNIEIRETRHILADDEAEFEQAVNAIRSTLQPDERVVVTKMITGSVTIIKTT